VGAGNSVAELVKSGGRTRLHGWRMSSLLGGPADGTEITVLGDPRAYYVSEHIGSPNPALVRVITHEYQPHVDGKWHYVGVVQTVGLMDLPEYVIGTVRYLDDTTEQVLFYRQEEQVQGLWRYMPEPGAVDDSKLILGVAVDIVPAHSTVGIRPESMQ
jgi:hypothetical protein